MRPLSIECWAKPSSKAGRRVHLMASVTMTNSLKSKSRKYNDPTKFIFSIYSILKREARKRKWVRRGQWVWDRVQAAFWISLSSLVIYKTNFFRQLWENEDINPMFMNLTLICLGINMSIMLFVTLIMPLQGKEPDLEKIPNLVPVMAICSVCLPLFLMIAIWPIWGFWSPFYLFILSLGYIFTLTFLFNAIPSTLSVALLLAKYSLALSIVTFSEELEST